MQGLLQAYAMPSDAYDSMPASEGDPVRSPVEMWSACLQRTLGACALATPQVVDVIGSAQA